MIESIESTNARTTIMRIMLLPRLLASGRAMCHNAGEGDVILHCTRRGYVDT